MRLAADPVHGKIRKFLELADMRPLRRANAGWAMRMRGSTYEVRKRGITPFDLRDPYHIAVTLSWPAFIIAALTCLAVINLVFAGLYLAQPGAVQNLAPGDLADAAFFSLETLATVGYGEMAPATRYGHSVAAIEIVVGMAFTAILTGILFVRFSRPKSKILFAESLVVTAHNGRPTLMIRIANGRLTLLTNARATVGVLMRSVSDEGLAYRGVHVLPLMRSEISIFPLTWTIMHVIDEDSPLHGFDAERMLAEEARIFVSVEARDTSTAAQVHDVREYSFEKIAFGVRYADMIMRDPEGGGIVADVRRLSDVEPQA